MNDINAWREGAENLRWELAASDAHNCNMVAMRTECARAALRYVEHLESVGAHTSSELGAAPAEEAKPVAWTTDSSYQDGAFTSRKETADAWRAEGFEVTPLYTRAAPAAQSDEDLGAIREQAGAWLAVYWELSKLCPGFHNEGKNGTESALIAIRALKSAAPATSQPTQHANKDVEWLLRCAEEAQSQPEMATRIRNNCKSATATTTSQPDEARDAGLSRNEIQDMAFAYCPSGQIGELMEFADALLARVAPTAASPFGTSPT